MSNLTVPSQHRGLTIYPDNDDAEVYEITIRFSASIPDLEVSLPVNNGPTTASLKKHVRDQIPIDLRNKRIRLIHAGKALDDATPLSTTLRRISNISTRTGTPIDDDRGKGKQPVREPLLIRVYIHCSIGDVTLSDDELAAEAQLAVGIQSQAQKSGEPAKQNDDTSTVTPAPRGFDRLLNAGFTPAEILSLRQQFESIQAHTHTPDTMPSPDTMRAIEDQWLDNSGSGLTLDTAGNGSTVIDTDDSGRGALDDMIWGTTLGFFWPVGCLIWGVREEGIFSPRRKIAIVIGVVINLGLGFVRWGG